MHTLQEILYELGRHVPRDREAYVLPADWYLTREGKAVPAGSTNAAYVLGGKGRRITMDAARMLGFIQPPAPSAEIVVPDYGAAPPSPLAEEIVVPTAPSAEIVVHEDEDDHKEEKEEDIFEPVAPPAAEEEASMTEAATVEAVRRGRPPKGNG